MPTPRTDVDREAARVLCVAIGVREAARRMGIPQPTMQAWSRRGKWFAKPQQPPTVVRPAAGTVTVAANGEKRIASSASNPADVLATRLADDSKATRIGLSTATRKAATTFGRKTGEGVIKEAQALRHVTAAASQLHGWEDGKQGGVTLNLGLVLGGMQ